MAALRPINDSRLNQTSIWLCSFLRKRGKNKNKNKKKEEPNPPLFHPGEGFHTIPSWIYRKKTLKSSIIDPPNPFIINISERLCPAQSHNSIPCTGGQAKFMIQNIYGPQIFESLLNLEGPEDFQLSR